MSKIQNNCVSHGLSSDKYQGAEVDVNEVVARCVATKLQKYGRVLRKPKPPPIICDIDVLTSRFKTPELCINCCGVYPPGTKHDCPNSPTNMLNEMQKAYLQMHDTLVDLFDSSEFENLHVVRQDRIEKAVNAGQKWL